MGISIMEGVSPDLHKSMPAQMDTRFSIHLLEVRGFFMLLSQAYRDDDLLERDYWVNSS
jgi:hypothetical protein